MAKLPPPCHRRQREKLHYLNPVPLHEIHERWIEKFGRSRLGALGSLAQTPPAS